jgi:hypothetical protein
MTTRKVSKKVAINNDIERIVEAILKNSPLKREELSKVVNINIKTLDRRLEILKQDSRYYLECEWGKPLQIKLMSEKQIKFNYNYNDFQEINTSKKNTKFNLRIDILKKALNQNKWLIIKNFRTKNSNKKNDCLVYPLKLVYLENEIKLIGLPIENQNFVNAYNITKIDDIEILKQEINIPNLKIDEVLFDDFGEPYTDKNKLYNLTLIMTEKAVELLKRNFSNLDNSIINLPTEEIKYREINNTKYVYEYSVEIKTVLLDDITRFIIGLFDNIIFYSENKEVTRFINNILENNIIPIAKKDIVTTVNNNFEQNKIFIKDKSPKTEIQMNYFYKQSEEDDNSNFICNTF